MKHGYTLKDKLVAFLPDYAPWASPWPAAESARQIPGLAGLSEKLLDLSMAPATAVAARTFSTPRPLDGRARVLGATTQSCCLSTPSTASDLQRGATFAVLQTAGYGARGSQNRGRCGRC
jgi:hypothetical protein